MIIKVITKINISNTVKYRIKYKKCYKINLSSNNRIKIRLITKIILIKLN